MASSSLAYSRLSSCVRGCTRCTSHATHGACAIRNARKVGSDSEQFSSTPRALCTASASSFCFSSSRCTVCSSTENRSTSLNSCSSRASPRCASSASSSSSTISTSVISLSRPITAMATSVFSWMSKESSVLTVCSRTSSLYSCGAVATTCSSCTAWCISISESTNLMGSLGNLMRSSWLRDTFFSKLSTSRRRAATSNPGSAVASSFANMANILSRSSSSMGLSSSSTYSSSARLRLAAESSSAAAPASSSSCAALGLYLRMSSNSIRAKKQTVVCERGVPEVQQKSSKAFSTMLKPLSLTYVEYDNGDLLGKAFALTSLSPVFLIVALTAVVVVRREMFTILFLAGLVLQDLANKVIKNIVQEARPLRSAGLQHEAHGMPSAHSQFMFFFAIVFHLWLWHRLTVLPRPEFGVGPRTVMLVKILLSLGVASYACVVAVGRLYLEYHTRAQVAVGGGLGVMLGVSWFWLVQGWLLPLFVRLEDTWLCRLLMIRDSTLIPDIMMFEYESVREQRKRHAQ
eukprot:m.116016 g.116016  ORF g.116016 m.116016 type:complete len:518 (+) comp19420_c0_seq5:926-2479(+)